MILDWLEVAVQATAAAGLMFTVTVCGLVMTVPFQPTLRSVVVYRQRGASAAGALAVKLIEKGSLPLQELPAHWPG